MPLRHRFWSQVVSAFYVLLQRKSFPLQMSMSFAPVSQIVRNDEYWAYDTAKSVSDARVNVVKLSDRGQQLIPTIKNQCIDVNLRKNLLRKCSTTYGRRLRKWSFAWKKRLLYSCKRKRKARESQQVEIIDYSPEFTKTSSVWTTSGLRNTSNWVNWPSVVKPPVRENFATWWVF